MAEPLTSDNNSPITKRIRTNDIHVPKCFSNLGDCSGLSQAYLVNQEIKTKEDTKIQATIQNLRKGTDKANPSSTMMWVWFRLTMRMRIKTI